MRASSGSGASSTAGAALAEAVGGGATTGSTGGPQDAVRDAVSARNVRRTARANAEMRIAGKVSAIRARVARKGTRVFAKKSARGSGGTEGALLDPARMDHDPGGESPTDLFLSLTPHKVIEAVEAA